MDLETLQQEVHEIAVDHGWWPYDNPPTVPVLIALLHSEVTEAFEEWRHDKPVLYYDLDGKPEGMAVELADIIIRVLGMSAGLNLPLIEAIRAKVAYNYTRPYRHGELKA